MGAREEHRIFVGGLAGSTTERDLEDAFSRYGKIHDSLVMLERETGRPRGFGFITFSDHRAMEEAIKDMHGRELNGRAISVNRAQPKPGEDVDHGYGRDRVSGGRDHISGGRDHISGGRDHISGGRDHISGGRDHVPGGRDSHRNVERTVGRSDCFKCGRPGHFARECLSADDGGRFSSNSRFGGVRGDRFGAGRYEDRFDGGRYGDRDHMDVRDTRYGSRDQFTNDRYPPIVDRFGGDRYIDREPLNGYGKDRGFDRDVGPQGAGDRYGGVGGPARYERGSFRDRSGPYDRPRRGGRASFDRY